MNKDDGNDNKGGGESNRQVRRERFVRVAQRRTRTVIERMRILGNCANRGVYDYSVADVDKIFGTLQHELDQARRRFDERMKRRTEFKLES